MISVSGVSKLFDEVHALDLIDLDIATGEFITIVGPSGCGKSTLLRIIAGIATPTGGSIKKPDASKGAFVFQDAALLPWRNVQNNVEEQLVQEPTVVNQWTDEAGHTWRTMSNDKMQWWNGNDWQDHQ